MCKFNRPMAMLKWYFLKERSDANYKSSGFQVTGPSRLKRVLKGINWQLSPINLELGVHLHRYVG